MFEIRTRLLASGSLLLAGLVCYHYSSASGLPSSDHNDQVYTGIEQGTGRSYDYVVNAQGEAIAFGDVIIGKHETIQQEGIRPLTVGPVSSSVGRKKRAAPDNRARLWDNNTVVYSLTHQAVRPNFLAAVDHIQSHVPGLEFVERTNENDYIQVIGVGWCGGQSAVGKKGGVQSLMMSYSPNCPMRVGVHELGHALGLWHEQQRPDRDYYVYVP